MDKDIFVQNIKAFCKLRGIKPTIACRESGAGANLINMLERRGSIPSVEKVQLLAQYLGVSTSDLLGEKTSFFSDGPAQPQLVSQYNKLSREDQEEISMLVSMKYQRALLEVEDAQASQKGKESQEGTKT